MKTPKTQEWFYYLLGTGVKFSDELKGTKAKCEEIETEAIEWERLAKFYEARIKQLAPAGWHPIETSAKDKKSRLVYCPERQNIYLVYWGDNEDWGMGWNLFGTNERISQEPSHWMQLPNHPQTP